MGAILFGTPFWGRGGCTGQRWYRSKERWRFSIASPFWPLRYLKPFGRTLPLNVSDDQINRAWVTGVNFGEPNSKNCVMIDQCVNDLWHLEADGRQNVFDVHRGRRWSQDSSDHSDTWRWQPGPTEMTDDGSHRRPATAWWTVDHQWTAIPHADIERYLQPSNARVAVA